MVFSTYNSQRVEASKEPHLFPPVSIFKVDGKTISGGTHYDFKAKKQVGKNGKTLASFCFADWDYDGDLDFIYANSAAQAEVFLLENKGNATQPKFSKESKKVYTMPNPSLNTRKIKLVDINGDGLLDILSAQDFTQLDLYLNTGTKETAKFDKPQKLFSFASGEHYLGSVSLDVVDINNDNKLDILLGGRGSKLNTFELRSYLQK